MGRFVGEIGKEKGTKNRKISSVFLTSKINILSKMKGMVSIKIEWSTKVLLGIFWNSKITQVDSPRFNQLDSIKTVKFFFKIQKNAKCSRFSAWKKTNLRNLA